MGFDRGFAGVALRAYLDGDNVECKILTPISTHIFTKVFNSYLNYYSPSALLSAYINAKV